MENQLLTDLNKLNKAGLLTETASKALAKPANSNTPTTVSPIVDVSTVGNTPQLNVPTPKLDTMTKTDILKTKITALTPEEDINTQAKNFSTTLTPQKTALEGRSEETLARFLDIGENLGVDRARLEKALSEEQDVSGKTQAVTDIENRVREKDRAYQNARREILEAPAITAQNKQARLDELERRNTIDKADLEVLRQSANNNLTTAYSIIESKLDLEFGALEQELELRKEQLNAISPFLDRESQKELQKQQLFLDERSRLLTDQREEQKTIDNIVANVAFNGNTALAEQIKATAKNSADAVRLAGELGMSPEQRSTLATQALQRQTEKLQQQKLLQDMEAEKPLEPTLQLSQTQSNVEQIENLVNEGGMSSAVGTSILTRQPSGFWGTVGKLFTGVGAPLLAKDAYNKLSGKSQNFIGDVEQIRSQLNLDTLVNAKERGATFGALSGPELLTLSQAGTKIGNWAITDDNGRVVGYNASEEDFKRELDKIKNFAKLDYVLKGGSPSDVGVSILPDGTMWSENSDGTLTQLN